MKNWSLPIWTRHLLALFAMIKSFKFQAPRFTMCAEDSAKTLQICPIQITLVRALKIASFEGSGSLGWKNHLNN